MSRIETNFAQLKNNSTAFHDMGQRVRAMNDSLTDITGNLDSVIHTSFSAAQIMILKAISDKMIESASRLETFSEALEYIRNQYLRSEQMIINSDAPAETMGSDALKDAAAALALFLKQVLKGVRDWMVEVGLVPAEKQTRVDGKAVTKHQEMEQDLYMKQQIAKIRENSMYSEQNWKNASPEERQKLLKNYIKEITAILGLNITDIDFSDYEPMDKDGYATMGYYNPKDDSVHINPWIIAEGDANGFKSYNLYTTVAHELRHAYQHAACNDHSRFVVTDETIASWQKSIDEYKSTEGFEKGGMSHDDAYKAYRNQTIERDARWFAGQD